MRENANRLRQRLRNIGLSDSAIVAAWPIWWSDAADASVSAQAELRFSLARKLGLDPHSLLEDDQEPHFIWQEEARFKHLRDEGAQERAAITSFGTALGKYMLEATTATAPPSGLSSARLRQAIVAHQPYVRLVDLLSVSWSLGIPLIHLRIFPCTRKRMSAMTVCVSGRSAIMIGKDSRYPPHIAFYIAHELGHIALGHLSQAPMVVDLERDELNHDDQEEVEADRFALELLTGLSRPTVLPHNKTYSARELARTALDAATELRVEPGTLALCFGFSTNDWATANAAMPFIYQTAKPVWSEINKVALDQLHFGSIPEDARSYLKAVVGEPQSA